MTLNLPRFARGHISKLTTLGANAPSWQTCLNEVADAFSPARGKRTDGGCGGVARRFRHLPQRTDQRRRRFTLSAPAATVCDPAGGTKSRVPCLFEMGA